MRPYYTVVIPPVSDEFATAWHAPDTTLTRGVFNSEKEAIAWARQRLGGAPYSIRKVDPDSPFEPSTVSP